MLKTFSKSLMKETQSMSRNWISSTVSPLPQAQARAHQCLFCGKDFDDRIKYKNHLRKKQHCKLHPDNKDYDVFYIVHYGTRRESMTNRKETQVKR